MNLLDVDDLQLYFGEPYTVNEKIVIQQARVGDIITYGEKDYYSLVHTLTAIPSDMKSQLFDDMRLDYEQISDFELFIMLAKTLPQSKTSIIFGDLDFSKFGVYKHPRIEDEIVFADKENKIMIDFLSYELIVNYLRKSHGLKKKVEKAANAYTKQFMIDEDRRNRQANENKPYKSFLKPLISSVKVRMQYTLPHVKQMGIVEFMDDVSRLQIIHNADALMQGCYAGTIDMKQINKKELNWMRELD